MSNMSTDNYIYQRLAHQYKEVQSHILYTLDHIRQVIPDPESKGMDAVIFTDMLRNYIIFLSDETAQELSFVKNN